MFHRRAIIKGIVLLAFVLGSFAPVTAQERVGTSWSPPFGVTAGKTVRIQVIPILSGTVVPPQGANVCDADLKLEILDARTLQALESPPVFNLRIGEGMVHDYIPQLGQAPERQEVVVKMTVTRSANNGTERLPVPVVCALVSSGQVFDNASGVTETVTIQVGYSDNFYS